jgi:exodeoxyribonuclease VII small subunit
MNENRGFEEALGELENVVSRLEGELKLEEALKLFDRGMQLCQHCEEFLKSAEQKIEILKKAADGTLATEKFNEETAVT